MPMLLEEMVRQFREHRPERGCTTCTILYKNFYETWYSLPATIDEKRQSVLDEIVTAYLRHHKEHKGKEEEAWDND